MINNNIKNLEKLIKEEKAKDQNEIIEFVYVDKESHTKIKVVDKRKIKVALLEMEIYERKQKSDIMEFECPYNAKTDDPVDEEQNPEFIFEQSEFEQNLEDALQEVVDKITKNKENFEKIKKIISDNLFDLTYKQVITIYLFYYVELSEQKIAEYLGVSRQRIHSLISRIGKKLSKNS